MEIMIYSIHLYLCSSLKKTHIIQWRNLTQNLPCLQLLLILKCNIASKRSAHNNMPQNHWHNKQTSNYFARTPLENSSHLASSYMYNVIGGSRPVYKVGSRKIFRALIIFAHKGGPSPPWSNNNWPTLPELILLSIACGAYPSLRGVKLMRTGVILPLDGMLV